MSADQRLIHDVAWAFAGRLVDLVRWEREEDRADAFKAFLPVVQKAIERYRLLKERELRRLAKNVKNPSEN